MRLGGDFLQLPPVRASSFATPVDIHSSSASSRAAKAGTPAKKATPAKPSTQTGTSKNGDMDSEDSGDEQTAEEKRQGLLKFRKVENVVCLNRVVRAPNSLGALCTFIRHCKITDEVWSLLQSRVIRQDDPRLQSPLWKKNPLKLIVQRHALRVSMSNAAVLKHSTKMSSYVYLVAARDDVDTAVPEIASSVQEHLQQKASFKQTGRRQSVLMLYKGARMLLDGKPCPTLGLMNGTEVVIEHILLNDRDRFSEPHDPETSNLVALRYMPEGLIVRAPGQKWILPEELLPGLPPETPLHKRRGLF